ncbi:hypothetical protein VNO78_34176 [Psophocarpus tetragonolobus]|uniref:Uncharacterized protein n=1 Tax=Psophocarpus tetragonolobus TaxID=3891 RepID=A0AAN9NWK2_PSOTE
MLRVGKEGQRNKEKMYKKVCGEGSNSPSNSTNFIRPLGKLQLNDTKLEQVKTPDFTTALIHGRTKYK